MKPEMVGDSWAATRLRISSSWRSGRVIVIFVVAIPLTIPQTSSLIRAQRLNRIDPRGPARRDHTRGKRRGHERDRRGSKSHRVMRAHSEQQAPYQVANPHRRDDADREPG